MTKAEVLSIFNRAWNFLRPDDVRARLSQRPDRRSLYTYLLRLSKQGLLEPRKGRRGTLAYRLTDRGKARLIYLKQVQKEKNKNLS
jgi:DNA-binding PadR family transcriptional regulator